LPGCRRLVWIDLTAGDGVVSDENMNTEMDWWRLCSPGLLAYYAVSEKSRKPIVIHLYELKTATFARLIVSLTVTLPELGYERTGETTWTADGGRVILHAINGSGHDARLDFIGAGDAVMVLNDPNAITDWAMRETFVQEIVARKVWCCRIMSTLGCNTAGIKRRPKVERDGWFGLVAQQESTLPRYRDLLLASIDRDDSQWAYLLCEPVKWRKDIERGVLAAFAKLGRTMTATWLRQAPDLFEEQKRVLFYTNDERKEMGL
jgi:hypothetical protein